MRISLRSNRLSFAPNDTSGTSRGLELAPRDGGVSMRRTPRHLDQAALARFCTGTDCSGRTS